MECEYSVEDEEFEADDYSLNISKAEADAHYEASGSGIIEPPDEISVEKYQNQMLSDQVHQAIMEVLSETDIKFKLSDFQLVSLHVIGNKQNLVLISPTGSGKMLG